MHLWFLVLSAAVGYLLGSVSFARIVTYYWTKGKDITDHEFSIEGSQDSYKIVSVGANSVSSLLGKNAGFIVSFLDIIKVFLPTLLFKLSFPDQTASYLIVALFGIIGHVWPIYHKFHGGAGFTAIMGGLLVIDWPSIFITPLIGLLLGFFVFRNLIVATLSWIWLLIPWFWWRMDGDPIFIGYSLAINIVFILAMIPEYRIAMEYRKKGKYLEYGIGSLNSNPMGRGLLKIAERLKMEIK